MAKCSVCEKTLQFGKQVSHSHRKSSKIWKPNVKLNGQAKRMYVCTSCLRSGKVERA